MPRALARARGFAALDRESRPCHFHLSWLQHDSRPVAGASSRASHAQCLALLDASLALDRQSRPGNLRTPKRVSFPDPHEEEGMVWIRRIREPRDNEITPHGTWLNRRHFIGRSAKAASG